MSECAQRTCHPADGGHALEQGLMILRRVTELERLVRGDPGLAVVAGGA